MTPLRLLAALATSLTLAALASAAVAAPSPAAAPGKPSGKGLSELGSSKEPIAIDADRLEVFDKEGRAVFSGNVIVVQGETTMKCTAMDVLYESSRGQGAKAAAPGLGDDSSIKKMECRGPVTITTKSQVATGDRAEFDKAQNKVFIIGNAALVDGPNVVKGERVAYDLTTSIARVDGRGDGGRVRTLIVPSSQKDRPEKGAKPPQREAKPDKEQKARKSAKAEPDDRSEPKPRTR